MEKLKSLNIVENDICLFYNLTKKQLRENTTNRAIIAKKHIFMYICYNYIKVDIRVISKNVSRHHASIKYSKYRCNNEHDLKNEYDHFYRFMKSRYILKQIDRSKITAYTYVKRKPIKMFKKPVIKLDLHYNFINEYDSILAASKQNNISYSGISKCCNHTNFTAGGYKWKFKKL